MGYKIREVNSHYRTYGARSCLRIDAEKDFTPEDVVAMLRVALRCGARFFDGEDDVYVVELPGRPQEVYTETALLRSIQPYVTR